MMATYGEDQREVMHGINVTAAREALAADVAAENVAMRASILMCSSNCARRTRTTRRCS